MNAEPKKIEFRRMRKLRKMKEISKIAPKLQKYADMIYGNKKIKKKPTNWFGFLIQHWVIYSGLKMTKKKNWNDMDKMKNMLHFNTLHGYMLHTAHNSQAIQTTYRVHTSISFVGRYNNED